MLIFTLKALPAGFPFCQDCVYFLRSLPLAPDSHDGDLSVLHIQFDQISFFHECNGTSCCRLRRYMPDDRSSGCSGESSVCDQCHAGGQLWICTDSLSGIEHLGHSAASGTLITDEYCISRLHFSVQHCTDACFLTVIGLCLQHCLEHIFRACRMLDHTPLRCQVALQDSDTTLRTLGVLEGVDNILSVDSSSE